ncbi:prolyl oligopeptidase family serine peptidase [Stieleria marina]|uniref:Putative hydrolase n=1 Tax=Stieleria marina TaxID=1930275 RepID=A0A517NZ81_9BACT|nr:putative hydrolase [Planctomycetes bacterium K23_9]
MSRILLISAVCCFFVSTLFAGEMQLLTQGSPTQELTPSKPLRYWLYEPAAAKVGAAKVAAETKGQGKTFPLVLFLHGGGEGGAEPKKVKKHGIPKRLAAGDEFPFYVVAPQNPSETQFWDDQKLIRLLDEVQRRYPISRSRVYVAGLSRGAYGAWRLAIQNPDRFAALVAVCGGGPLPYVNRIKHLPIWVFHGAQDPVISISESQRLVDSLREAGGDVKFTIYPDAQHDAWTQAFDDPELYRWMLEQKKSAAAK